MQIISIVWTDAVGREGWLERSDIHTEPSVIQVVGFLLKEDDNQITIFQAYDEADDKYENYITIPKAMIKQINRFDITLDDS